MKKDNVFAVVASTLALALVALPGCGDDNGTPNQTTEGGSDAPMADTGPGEAGTGSETGAPETGAPDTGTAPESGTADTGVVADTGAPPDASEAGPQFPAPPTLGTQIDRMGRPAINTALNNTFNTDTTSQGAAKDAYNADSVPIHWATYIPEIKKNLAVYDGLDTVCGNQTAYGALATPDYTTLANVLVGDTLLLNAGSTTCSQYLAVEVGALTMTPPTDCGGRTLTENVIDFTYNALAGTPQGTATNGITAPASAPATAFPYLATPH